ncbi:hypothetical protein [Evansella halocellulosilytica]|uniref:hypothetical protein n=1 Tax=Evansella halocellulosilytica TaxID=2011013 RepID=UPI001155627D|nr:hypothetical protein [Evansella halocellulosilytica]
MPGMPQDVAYCPVDGYNHRSMLEEEKAALAPAVTRRRKTVLLRLLVAEKQCSCGYSSQTMCFFLYKINRRRECVEAARREFREESLVAPAVTRRRLCASSSTRLIEEENASKQLVENSEKNRSLLLRLLVADYVLLPLQD